MDIKDIKVKYDSSGRMLYHPFYHPNHGKSFSESDKEYLCKYYHCDPVEIMALALGRTESTVREQARKLRNTGLFDKTDCKMKCNTSN